MKSPALPLRAFLLLLTLLACCPQPHVYAQGRNLGIGSSQAGAGGYHALVIGNNNYASLDKLKTAEADARQVAALLKESYGFETQLLLNATRAQIVSALSAYRRRLGPGARLLIYYAGHGFNDTATEKTYWLPVDAEREDTVNWIIADEITSTIKAIPARHVLVVSDSCYSGTLTRELGVSVPPPGSERERFIERMAAGRSRMLMASGGNEPVADGGGSGHSVFAAALLRGLREMGHGRFTAAELFRDYVVERVVGRADQTPEYSPIRNSGHESGDFVFVRVKMDEKNVEATVKAPTPVVNPSTFEFAFWEAIKGSRDPEDFREYLSKYPEGQFAGIARRRLASLTPASTKPPAADPATPAPTRSSALQILMRGDSESALRMVTAILRSSPRDAVALRIRAAALRFVREEERAKTDESEALRLLSRPSGAEQYEARCYVLYRAGRLDEAIADCTQAIRLDPGMGAAYHYRALSLNDRGDYDRAIADYNEAIRLDPRRSWSYYGRGDCYDNKGDYDRAIADYNEAIRLDPKYAEAYYNRAVIYYRRREHDRAIADFGETIRLDPKAPEPYNNRGGTYVGKGDYDKAIADYTEAIKLDPKYVSAYSNRCFVYVSKRDYDKAIADCNEAIRLDPNYATAYNSRGMGYYGKGEHDKGMADFSEAIRLNPKFASAYKNRALYYEMKGDAARAAADRQKAKEIETQ